MISQEGSQKCIRSRRGEPFTNHQTGSALGRRLLSSHKSILTGGSVKAERDCVLRSQPLTFGHVKTSPLAIIYFLIAAFLGALGQFLYKSGAEKTDGTFGSYLFNVRLIAGAICYIAVMALFVAAFKKGGALTVLYPVYASTFIFAAIIAWLAYGTPIRGPHFSGFALLIAGMYLLGR